MGNQIFIGSFNMEKEAARKRKPKKTKVPVLSGKDFEAISSDVVKREVSSIGDAQLKKVLLNLLAGLDKSDFPELKTSLAGYGVYLKHRKTKPVARPTGKRSSKKKAPTSKLVRAFKWPLGRRAAPKKKTAPNRKVPATSFLKTRPAKMQSGKMRRAFRKVKKWIF